MDASTGAMRVGRIPLDRLEISPRNVRTRTGEDEGAFARLQASIRAHGLLCPLIVEEAHGGPAVLAGGRRLRALRALSEEGALAPDHPVECIRTDSPEASLAENWAREPLHPVDEAAAFTALREAGASIAGLAARFGCSESTVRRRLSLGGVAPELLERCRAGELTLAHLEAVTLTDDHARQVRTVEEACDAWEVRQILTRAKVSEASQRGAYVGRQAYEEAGGTVTQDLFAPAGGAWLDDPALVDRLARKKLRKAAEKERAAGWTVSIGLGEPPWDRAQIGLGKAQAPEDLPEGLREGAELYISPGYCRNRHQRVVLAGANGAGGPEANGKAHLPAKFRDDLRWMRSRLLADSLVAGPPDVARDLLVYSLAEAVQGDAPETLAVRKGRHTADAAAGKIAERNLPSSVAAAGERVSEAEGPLLAWYGAPTAAERFAALRGLPEEAKERLLAVLVARLLRPSALGGAADAAVGTLGIDWGKAFDPGEPVLRRLPRARLLEIAEECVPQEMIEAPGPLEGLKKSEIVEALAGAFARYREVNGRSPWVPGEIAGSGTAPG